MLLSDSVYSISGVGEVVGKKLEQMGISSIEELVSFYPRKYQDYSNVVQVSKLRPGMVTIKATFKQVTGRYVRRGLHITEAVASDDTGSVRIIWFNQPYRKNAIEPNVQYFVSGQFELSRQHLSIMNPSCEKVSDFPVHTARIVPVYPHKKNNLETNQIRKLVRVILTKLKDTDTLPAWLVAKEKLPTLASAIKEVHFPSSLKALDSAKQRLGFEELFCLILAAKISKDEINQHNALEIPFKEKLAKDFVKHLPFNLTDDQRKVIWQIYLDMAKTEPMNRLIEGDVGSGKTVVATMAALMAMEQGFQVAFMAPTELLAQQHANTIHNMLDPLGLSAQVALLTGTTKPKAKTSLQKKIENGTVKFIVGTHTLIQEKLKLHNLGLVIVDEQHRFGVDQRKKLLVKAGHAVHILTMSATPIPRSLALTLYGELSISTINQKPKNRLPIITKLSPPTDRKKVYAFIDAELKVGRQAFFVCPLIEESDGLPAKSVAEVKKELDISPLQKYRIEVLHGKLKADDKQAIMQKFAEGEIDILVTTTVIEVGVDVPNVSVMAVESPERFGLAQLHQLRGRVGRGEHQGHCFVMLSDNNRPSRRLGALARSNDGFALAELDLEIRGPGALYGTAQHGQLDLKVAQFNDTKLVQRAKKAVAEFLKRNEKLVNYTYIAARVERLRAVTTVN